MDHRRSGKSLSESEKTINLKKSIAPVRLVLPQEVFDHIFYDFIYTFNKIYSRMFLRYKVHSIPYTVEHWFLHINFNLIIRRFSPQLRSVHLQGSPAKLLTLPYYENLSNVFEYFFCIRCKTHTADIVMDSMISLNQFCRLETL